MKQLHLLASRHSAFYTPFIGVISGGFLEKEGLAASYSVATIDAPAMTQIMDGRAQVAQSAVSGSWSALDKGLPSPVAHFAQINRHDGFFIASRQPASEFEWGNLLSGKTIYVHGGQPEAMLRYALHLKSVDLDDVQGLSTSGTEEMMRLWRSGTGDFFHEQGSYPQQLAYEGVAYVAASVGEVIGPVAFSSLCCDWKWLETDDAKRFTVAYAESRNWANSADPVEIARSVASFFPNHSVEAISESVRFYQKIGSWSGGISIEPPLYEKALDVFEHSSLVGDRHKFASVVADPPSWR